MAQIGKGTYFTIQHKPSDGDWGFSNFDSVAAAGRAGRFARAAHDCWAVTGEHGYFDKVMALDALHQIRVANEGSGTAFRLVQIDYDTRLTPVDV